MTRLTLVAAAIVALCSSAVQAEPNGQGAATAMGRVTDPTVAVQNIYDPDNPVSAAGLPMTRRLKALFRNERAHLKASGEPIGRLDFDWTVNGQDAKISQLEIIPFDVPGRGGGAQSRDQSRQRIVTASFRNFDTPTEINYYWVRSRRGWKLDDVTGYSEGGHRWTLSLLLGYGI